MANESKVGERIKERRLELKFTQEELARLAGLSKGFLSDLENGNRSVRAENLLSIARALSVSLDYLMKGDGQKVVEQPEIQIPNALADLAKEIGLTFSQTLMLLDMRSQILAHRSTSKTQDYEQFDWRKFHESLKHYIK